VHTRIGISRKSGSTRREINPSLAGRGNSSKNSRNKTPGCRKFNARARVLRGIERVSARVGKGTTRSAPKGAGPGGTTAAILGATFSIRVPLIALLRRKLNLKASKGLTSRLAPAVPPQASSHLQRGGPRFEWVPVPRQGRTWWTDDFLQHCQDHGARRDEPGA